MPEGERRLAAVMFTDIVGYTSLTQRDESSSLQALERHRSLLRPQFTSHGGREVKTIGDAFLVEFGSALDAVLCAVSIQQVMHDRKVARGETTSLRIGIHVGDVIESAGDILGDAVNIAARVEPLAEVGGVCISGQVFDQVRNKSGLSFTSLGEVPLKNVSSPVTVYRVSMPWEQSASAEPPAFSTSRIAVLPFRNMSPDPNDEYFAEGITEEIISTVAGISGLDVISRTSVMSYKGTTKRIEDIGKELKVGSVLEGSFRKAGNRIRVTTQLIEVARDRHLWAQNYDRNLDDVFEVQSDVARQVADALRVKILSEEKERIVRKPTESAAAYSLYMKGRYLWNKRGLDQIKQAVSCFEEAVKGDPAFALGYVGLADCFSLLRVNEGVDREANLAKTEDMVAKALELDPDLAEAHTAKGSLLGQEYDLQGAEAEFKKAIELKPGYPTAHQWYSYWVLYAEQRWGEALQHIEKALELDPLSPIININYGDYFRNRREYPKALEVYRRAAALDPSLAAVNLRMADTYKQMKSFEDMDREIAVWVGAARETHPLVARAAEAEAALCRGDLDTVRRALPELEANLGASRLGEYGVAHFHFALGDTDGGFEWLNRSYSNKEAQLTWLKSDPDLDGVRQDPRYLELLKKLRLG